MPDFYSILDERMRIAWESLARRTNQALERSRLDLNARGLLGSGFELNEYARVRAEAITERGDVVWQCISDTLNTLQPPYDEELPRRLRRLAESHFPDPPAQEYQALQEQVTRLDYAPALRGMMHEVDRASHQARRALMLKLDEELLRRKLASVQQHSGHGPDLVSAPSTWSDAQKWTMGIAGTLLTAAIIALAGYFLRSPTGVRNQDVPFTASSETNFAIQSTFAGTVKVRNGELTVEIARANIAYKPNPAGYSGPRRVVDLRVSVVEDRDGGSWKPVRQSELKAVDRQLQGGEQLSLEPFSLHLSVAGLPSLSGLWLVFDIDEETPGTMDPGGLSHAHSRLGIFSD